MAPDRKLPKIDAAVPNTARMHDYLLGGKDNFAVDREAADHVLAVAPEARRLVRMTKGFVCRAVRHLHREGIRQFIDIGPGLPTGEPVHLPGTRVAFVDNDPMVLTHARAVLSRSEGTMTVRGDLRDPEAILRGSDLRQVIDLAEPVAILLSAVLHHLTDEDKPAEVAARLRDMVAPGSSLVLSHVTTEDHPEVASAVARAYARANSSLTPRSREQIMDLFDGWRLIEPGLVAPHEWRPDQSSGQPNGHRMPPTWVLCGVAEVR